MKAKTLTPRQRLRNRPSFPSGMYTGLLTAACITLIGVAIKLDPLVILMRAALSAVILGILVSFGTSIVRMMHAEHKTGRHTRR